MGQLMDVARRYAQDASFSVELKDKEGHPIVPAQHYAEAFAEWKQIRSPWDRRRLLYEILDQHIGNELPLWKVVARFIDTRQAEHALEIAKKYVTQEDRDGADFWAAVARANFVLQHYQACEELAEKCLSIDPENRNGKIVMADLYHCTGREGKAHEMYGELLKSSRLSELPKDKSVQLGFHELVGVESGVLPSPVYAAAWLNASKENVEEGWEWAGNEFYYSPHFRCQHAYYLLKKKDMQSVAKGFSKLLILSQEMPWVKEAVINAYNLIGQLQFDEQCREDKARLQQIMQENNWDPADSGMHAMTF